MDPNPQAQFLNLTIENIRNDPVEIPTGILGYFDFPQRNHELQSPPQPYAV